MCMCVERGLLVRQALAEKSREALHSVSGISDKTFVIIPPNTSLLGGGRSWISCQLEGQ